MKPKQVFVLENDATFGSTLSSWLKDEDVAVHTFREAEALTTFAGRHARESGGAIVAALPAAGFGSLRTLCGAFPHLPFVATIARPSVSRAVECMRRGAAYVLHKPFSRQQLLRVLDRVTTTRSPAAAAASPDDDVRHRLASLSPRQKQILGQVFEGRINKTIAHNLGISIKTVELHRSKMMRKMRAASAVELIRMTTPYSAILRQQAGT